MNILDELGRKRGFTESEEAIADYLLIHKEEIPATAIGDLARSMHRSKSSIVRLCRKLGLDGYRELKIEVARELERNWSAIQEVNPDRPFIEDSTTADIMHAIAALDKQAVDATRASISLSSIRRAARLVLESRHVVYYAIGDSCAAMAVFVQLLNKIGVICTSGLPMGDRGVLGRVLDARDLAIIVSHSGNIVDTYRSTIDQLRARGCKTILITANRSLGEHMLGTDCVFILPEGESRNERIATFYSQACTQYVLNCVYAEAFSRNYQGNLGNWQDEMRQVASQSSRC